MTQNLSFEKLFIYYGAKGLKLKPETFKKNLGLLTEDGKYNILAQLLSDNSHIPIRVSIFTGKTKADNLFSVREFGYQCLLYSLDEILRYCGKKVILSGLVQTKPDTGKFWNRKKNKKGEYDRWKLNQKWGF